MCQNDIILWMLMKKIQGYRFLLINSEFQGRVTGHIKMFFSLYTVLIWWWTWLEILNCLLCKLKWTYIQFSNGWVQYRVSCYLRYYIIMGTKKRIFHIHIYKLIKRFHFTFCLIIHYMNEFHTDLSEFWYIKGYQNGSMN